MWISARFMDASGYLDTLTPAVTVYNLTDGTEDVSAAAMVFVGMGLYKYNFAAIDRSKDYVFVADGGAAITSPFLRYVYGAIDNNGADIVAVNNVVVTGTGVTADPWRPV